MILPSDHIFAGLPGAELFLDERVTLFANECMQMMAHMPADSNDAVATLKQAGILRANVEVQ